VVTALAGLVVFAAAVWVPALWLDEATTVVLIRRSWSELFAVGLESDPALLPYYVLVKPVLGLGGEMWTVRLVSVIAAAVCVGAVLWFARRALGTLVGLVASAVVVVLPVTTLYAQQARPQALALAAVVVAIGSWWRAGPEDAGRRWWAAYAVALAAVALANMLALLVVLAPLAASLVLPADRRRGVLARTSLLALGVAVLLSPYLYVVLTRAKGVASPRPVAGDSVWELLSHPVGGGVLGAVLLTVALAAAALLLRGSTTRTAGVLLAVWAFAPGVALVVLAVLGRPVLVPRYAVVSLPAVAILLAAAAVRTAAWLAERLQRMAAARIAAAGAVVVLALLLLPQSLAGRAPDGHGEDNPPALSALEAEPVDLLVVATNRISVPTIQAYAPLVVAERMPQVADPSPHGQIAPERRPPDEVAPVLAAADSVLLLVRLAPGAAVPIPESRLPEGLKGRHCTPTVLASGTGWASERLDCPPHA
jgi:mannosyltransferase